MQAEAHRQKRKTLHMKPVRKSSTYSGRMYSDVDPRYTQQLADVELPPPMFGGGGSGYGGGSKATANLFKCDDSLYECDDSRTSSLEWKNRDAGFTERNANMQLRADPYIAPKIVSPFMQSTIMYDSYYNSAMKNKTGNNFEYQPNNVHTATLYDVSSVVAAATAAATTDDALPVSFDEAMDNTFSSSPPFDEMVLVDHPTDMDDTPTSVDAVYTDDAAASDSNGRSCPDYIKERMADEYIPPKIISPFMQSTSMFNSYYNQAIAKQNPTYEYDPTSVSLDNDAATVDESCETE